MRRLPSPSRPLLRRAFQLAAASSNPPVSRTPCGRRSMAILSRFLRGYQHGADPYRERKYKDPTGGFVVRNNGDDGEEVSDGERTMNSNLRKSAHRDGSIYSGIDCCYWKKEFHVGDRSETRLEPMAFSEPTPDCTFGDDGITCCWKHCPRGMLQVLSLEVARIPVDAGGSVEVYGYVAARDYHDPLRNYIVNISRDDPVVVEQGSLINITGSKRGIDMSDTLIEYDMRIKNGKEEHDDLQLLDGATILDDGGTWDRPFTLDTPGDYGVIDITLVRIPSAVEATIKVFVLQVQNSFNLSLGCYTSGFSTEIRLFDGVISYSRGLKRSVVAVSSRSFIELKFNVGAPSSSPDQHCCSFKPESHGHAIQKIKTKFALISVKVTWSTLSW